MASKLDIIDWGNLDTAEFSTAIRLLASAMQERATLSLGFDYTDPFLNYFEYGSNTPVFPSTGPVTRAFVGGMELLFRDTITKFPNYTLYGDGLPFPGNGSANQDFTTQSFLDAAGITEWYFTSFILTGVTTPQIQTNIITREYIDQWFKVVTFLKHTHGVLPTITLGTNERWDPIAWNPLGAANKVGVTIQFTIAEYPNLYHDPGIGDDQAGTFNNHHDNGHFDLSGSGDLYVRANGKIEFDMGKRRTNFKLPANIHPQDAVLWEYYSDDNGDDLGLRHRPLNEMFRQGTYSYNAGADTYKLEGHLTQDNRPPTVLASDHVDLIRRFGSLFALEFWDAPGGYEYYTP